MRMNMMTALAAPALVLAAPFGAGASPSGAVAPMSMAENAVDLSAAPSGHYAADPGHHQLLFYYEHQGFSHSWVRWSDWTGDLDWNVDKPEASSVAVTIKVDGVDTGVEALDAELKSQRFFDAAKYPTISFKSTKLIRTGPNSGVMTGDLTIKGVTKPASLDVVINKAGGAGRSGSYKLGFSARGAVKRSDYGIDAFAPFVGDQISIVIECEFSNVTETE